MPEETCWTLIRGAAEGRAEARAAFCQRYVSVVRGYLSERWRGGALAGEVEDAIQEVFLECLRPDGALARFDESRASRFSAYLRAIVENVARRAEERFAVARGRSAGDENLLVTTESRETRMSQVFQRELAVAIVRQARQRHREIARSAGPAAERRFELLRLRFEEEHSLRDIASTWRVDPAEIHREYSRAREDFKHALRDVVRFHNPSHPEAVERDCQELLGLFG